MTMSDRKKNRLKLKGIGRVKNAGQENIEKKNQIQANHDNPFTSISKSDDVIKRDISDEGNIFIIIEDEKEDCSNDNDKCDVNKPKHSTDQHLLELRAILNNIPFPFYDVWQLPDLPIYKTKGSPKINGKEGKTKTDSDHLSRHLLENPSLPRLKREYLCRKKTFDSINVLEDNSDSESISTFESGRVTNSKRKCSDTSQVEMDSKRLKLNESSRNTSAASSSFSQETNNVHPRLEDVKCSVCPICSTTFDIRMKPIDIDSHIASCFSEAGDDITW